MQDKIIFQMVNALRGTFRSEQESLEFSLLILAWVKLSTKEAIPEELRLTVALLSDPSQAIDVLIRLGKTGALEAQAFADAQRYIRVDSTVLRTVFDLALRLRDAGLLQGFDAADAICSLPQRAFQEISLPPGVANLLVALASICPSDSVYTPWDIGGQLAARAAKESSKVYLETPQELIIPASVSLLAERSFEVHQADPIRSPSAVEGGKPRRFDVAIAFPPLGERYDADVAEHDWFGRFPERTTSGTVLAVRHLLSQARRRVVAAVQSTLLFSSGVEQTLREDLVKRGILESVIQMPSGLFTYSNFPFAILILDPDGGHDHIKFINADSSRFREPISKARNRLVDLEHLVELTFNDAVSGESAIVSNADVLGNDAQLVVGRYVFRDATRRLFELLRNGETVKLRDVVTTIRPMPTTPATKDSIQVQEIAAADLPPFGYISTPGRSVMVECQVAEKNDEQFLRPLDIVLIIKGSVGKVGIVSEDVPPPGAGGWIAGQSAIVLRSYGRVIGPRALAIQMRSSLGQELFKTVVSGATIPLIQLKQMMNLPVLVPDSATAQLAADTLERETHLQREIDSLKQTQAKTAMGLWTL